MKIVEKSILSTDLAMYFRKKDRFIDLVENGEIAWQGDDKKECKFLKIYTKKV
jgi:cGMP-specific 3',5'-cyclic phosphodiesterase